MRKKGKQIYLTLVGCFVASMLVFVYSAPAAEKPAKVGEVRVHSQMPVGHFNTKAIDFFIAEAEKRSNKTLHFIHYPAQQLYTDEQITHILPEKGVEMAMLDFYKFTGTVPEGMLTTPFFLDTDWYMRWWYDTGGGGGHYYKILKPAFERGKIHLLSTLNYAPGLGCITTKPVQKLADYKGMKIRAGGKSMGAICVKWGAKVVVTSSSDVYMALQRRMIDGAISGPSSIVSRKWFEMADYYQDLGTGNHAMGIGANLAFWKSLTPAQQTAVEEAARAAEIWCLEASVQDHLRSLEIMKKAGIKIFEFPSDQYSEMVSSGLEALKEIVEPEVGASIWNEAMRLRANTKDGKLTAKEILQSRKFVQ